MIRWLLELFFPDKELSARMSSISSIEHVQNACFAAQRRGDWEEANRLMWKAQQMLDDLPAINPPRSKP